MKLERLIINGSVILLALLSGCSDKTSKGTLDYVDPDIGGVGLILQPTRPSVQRPNKFIRVYPVRRDYLHDEIRSFPLSLISHRNGELFGIMPFTGRTTGVQPSSAWDQQLEKISPYFLTTWLESYNITVEFTPGRMSGFYRFTYHEDSLKKLNLGGIRKGYWLMVDRKNIIGEDNFYGMKAYVAGSFNNEFEMTDTIINGRRRQYLTFDGRNTSAINFKYAISFISSEQAAASLKAEIPEWDFDQLLRSAKDEWSSALGKIRVKGGSEADKRTFYTALYRCYERMVDINEGGRYFSNYDKKEHESSEPFYIDDWVWDTYLAHHPLRLILDPETEAKMLQSYVDMYHQSGWMPTFPILWGDNPCMNGFHSTISILDAYRKGVRNFDIEGAYEGMRKNAVSATMIPWRNGPAWSIDSFYYEKGYYPALHPGETEYVPYVHPFEKRQAVAVTLGHSYDDWALAQMAKELKKDSDYEVFMKRSSNFKNLWDQNKGFFMPKDSAGNWIDIDPLFDGGMGGRDYYDENNGYTYLWQVQHNLPELLSLLGGSKGFEDRLDDLFTADLGRSKYETWAKFPDFTGIVGQFSMGNEPSFHIPYLYNLTDSPWKTQKRIRMLLDAWFTDNIFGIPGDEDGGGMSAFVVFSAMGFYPLVPGIPVYTIGSPLFERIDISLPGGRTFSVIAANYDPDNKYIQGAWLDGKKLQTPWFLHSDLVKGGRLVLEMGPYPSYEWGRGSLDDFKKILATL
jgi:predicted alpha-1,2-mannosidase